MYKVILMIVVLSIMSVGCTHIVSTNERSVIVESQSLNASEAQELADKECAKKNRIAMMSVKGGYWDRNYVFNCVLSDLPSSKNEASDTLNKTTSQKLRDLQTLKSDGLISDEEYQKKRKQLIEQF